MNATHITPSGQSGENTLGVEPIFRETVGIRPMLRSTIEEATSCPEEGQVDCDRVWDLTSLKKTVGREWVYIII